MHSIFFFAILSLFSFITLPLNLLPPPQCCNACDKCNNRMAMQTVIVVVAAAIVQAQIPKAHTYNIYMHIWACVCPYVCMFQFSLTQNYLKCMHVYRKTHSEFLVHTFRRATLLLIFSPPSQPHTHTQARLHMHLQLQLQVYSCQQTCMYVYVAMYVCRAVAFVALLLKYLILSLS